MSRVYLDWAAAAPPDPEILDSVSTAALRFFGNPSAVHASGREAAAVLEEDRGRLARILDCLPDEVLFTGGGSESNNMVLFSLLQPSPAAATPGGVTSSPRGGETRRRGSIVISAIEHASVFKPALALGRYGWEVKIVPARTDGRVDPGRIAAAVDEGTSLVALMLVSNETGAIQPVAEVGAALRELGGRGRKVHLHCDAVQAFGKIPVHPRRLNADSLSISAHKVGGPRGVGALFLDRKAKREFLYVGGDQERGRRPGTENLPGIHGLVLSAEKACAGLDRNLEHANHLMEVLLREVQAFEEAVVIPSVRAPASGEYSPYILNVAFPPVPGEVLVRVLEEEGYVISTGSACSSRKKSRFRVHEGMGIPGSLALSSVRISFGASVEPGDIEGFGKALRRRLPELLRVALA